MFQTTCYEDEMLHTIAFHHIYQLFTGSSLDSKIKLDLHGLTLGHLQ